MGILYKAVQTQAEMKRNFVLGRLKEMNVTVSKQGKSLDSLDYNDLKQELVLAHYRQIDSQSTANKWF